jgi:HlyD family secretion protein
MRKDGMQSRAKKNKAFYRMLIIVGLLGTAIICMLSRGTAYLHLAGVFADVDQEPIPVFEVKKEAHNLTISAHGEITGESSESIRAPRTRARPLTIAWLIPEGSHVHSGDTLLRFANTEAELSLEKQQIALAEIEERLKILSEDRQTEEKSYGFDIASAEMDFRYARNILPEDKLIYSKWDILEANRDLVFAEEKVKNLEQKRQLQAQKGESEFRILMIEKKQIEEKIETARNILDSMELVSPISGLITYHRRRGQQPQAGDQCWPGQELLEVIDLNKLQARFYVLERDAGALENGMQADIRLDAFPERRYKSTIKSISQVAQSIERNSPLLYFTCDASLSMPTEDIHDVRPGMLLQTEVIKQRFDSCVVVPSSAVTTKDEEHLVYIEQGNTFLPRPVEIVNGSKGQTVILNGIREGEILALHNPYETRKLSLPDFGKAVSARENRPPRGRPGSRRR